MIDKIILCIGSVFTFMLGFLFLGMNEQNAIGPVFIAILLWIFSFASLIVAQKAT